MEEFIGRTVDGKITQYPKRYATGGGFGKKSLNGVTKVDLGDGAFYVLPSGTGFSPNHTELEKFFQSPRPAKRASSVKPKPAPVPD